MKEITLQITTINRAEELEFTLNANKFIINDSRVHTIVCIDSFDHGAYSFIEELYPQIQIIKNKKNIGVIASRNLMMSITTTPYSISLDDDAHFINNDSIDQILNFFKSNPNCSVIAFRIYWGTDSICYHPSNEDITQVKSYVGCGHAWRLSSWKLIPDYPSWFYFHGEEDFASFQLIKKKLKIIYLPTILVHHRVDIIKRSNNSDFLNRYRMSLRSGYFIWLMFVPLNKIVRLFVHSFLFQLRKNLYKGNIYVIKVYFLVVFDILFNLYNIMKNSNRLSNKEYSYFQSLSDTKINWKMVEE